MSLLTLGKLFNLPESISLPIRLRLLLGLPSEAWCKDKMRFCLWNVVLEHSNVQYTSYVIDSLNSMHTDTCQCLACIPALRGQGDSQYYTTGFVSFSSQARCFSSGTSASVSWSAGHSLALHLVTWRVGQSQCVAPALYWELVNAQEGFLLPLWGALKPLGRKPLGSTVGKCKDLGTITESW